MITLISQKKRMYIVNIVLFMLTNTIKIKFKKNNMKIFLVESLGGGKEVIRP